MTQTMHAPAGAVAAELRFAGHPVSVGQARAMVAVLLGTGCPRLDDVLLVVSELAGNAVLHSASGMTGGTFDISVTIEPGAVAVAVADQGPALVPAMRGQDEGGHGLTLVAALVDAYEVTVTGRGRIVWCRFAIASGGTS